MVEILKILAPALLGIIGGVLSGWFTQRSGYAIKQKEKENEERDKLKLQYLDPLRVATQDLRDRLIEIRERQNQKDPILQTGLQQLISNKTGNAANDLPYKYIWQNKGDYAEWANGIGCFSLSTLRTTALYFYQASKILQELPYVKLSSGDDVELRKHLINVRSALGGSYGIWNELQDSIGEYLLKENGKLRNYREFCYEIIDDVNYFWFYRPIRFFADFHLKSSNEVDEMIQSLDTLDRFLSNQTPHENQSKPNIRFRSLTNHRVHRTAS
ncbi:hypothetical protein A0J48_015125 [Sphaerospermopsis aphanizomenoides BCCUSP55]|uniref:hypothetical protein n=1 Tax=Sphaerospermopsis aphanizomenoides TaxID=459663 RepID=UPI001906483A|nr:hypothetical protein [Sphaerospermopsis aphanizomenoides]MBK1988853.1 hypothetical protein [Sphaerospermopsis aphanizomenoides BCCUSP55]